VAIVPVFFDSLFKVRRCLPAACLLLVLLLRGQHQTYDPAQQASDAACRSALLCRHSMLQVWIFIGLNKQDPAAAVTLKQMDRH
jgi:hypothetical protein